jgi:hypothetical protein
MSRTLNDIININGTVITHKILFIAVKDIERAIFPLANDVKTLLVTPPIFQDLQILSMKYLLHHYHHLR